MDYHSPLRIIIPDWNKIKRIGPYRKYFLVDSIMEYKGRYIELCIPYKIFIIKLRKLPINQQKLIIEGRAVIELMKTPQEENHGIKINKVEEWKG